MSANWANFVDALVPLSGANQTVPQSDLNLTGKQLARTAQEIKISLAGLPLPLASGSWNGLGVNPAGVTSGAAPSAVLKGKPPRLEVLYRNSLTSYDAEGRATATR